MGSKRVIVSVDRPLEVNDVHPPLGQVKGEGGIVGDGVGGGVGGGPIPTPPPHDAMASANAIALPATTYARSLNIYLSLSLADGDAKNDEGACF